LTNDDHIYFEDFYQSGGPSGKNDYAVIESPLIGTETITNEFMEELEQHGGIIRSVLNIYEKLLSKKKEKHVDEKFTDKGDPIKDMGIGMSEAEAILVSAVKLFGKEVMVHKNTPEEKKEKRFPYEMNRSLPMSDWDWSNLKKEVGLKRIPNKYVDKIWDRFGAARQLNFCKLLEDIYGENFYFDDMDLVQSDRTIVSLFGLDGLTFEELIEQVKNSGRLLKKGKRTPIK